MQIIKDQFLRVLDDTGAETIRDFWSQIMYTAAWCLHLISQPDRYTAIIPEGGEDLTIEGPDNYSLHQVKTRGESQPKWTTADVLPFLCKQYTKRHQFHKECRFYWATDYSADNETKLSSGPYGGWGSLHKLAHHLDILHDDQFTREELEEFQQTKAALVPHICEIMRVKHHEDLSGEEAEALLERTWIRTEVPAIKEGPSIEELHLALNSAGYNDPDRRITQLQEILKRIAWLIVRRILDGNTVEERTIRRDDVLTCYDQVTCTNSDLPDLGSLPGSCTAEKVARYGGFLESECGGFLRQMNHARFKRRKLESLGLVDALEDLNIALIAMQHDHRDQVSRTSSTFHTGPEILRCLRPEIPLSISKYCPQEPSVDEPFCRGLLWIATDVPDIWWHRLRR